MKSVVSTITICLLISSCASIPDKFVSPGRIQRETLSSGLKPIKEICANLENCTQDNLEIIAHGAGSYRNYPLEIRQDGYVLGNKWDDKCEARAKNINDLMDLTFATGEVNAIEIDVQAPDSDHPLCENGKDCLYIIHNKQNWDSLKSLDNPAIKYLQNNTINTSLAHFISNGYYKDRHVYLEIKSTRGCNAPNRNDSECRDLGLRVANEILDDLQWVDNLSEKQNPNWLTIVSFSATALQAVRDGLKNDFENSVNYGLIAGVYPFSLKWFIGQAKGSVPLFNRGLQHFAETTPWLDTIWFSPQGISDFSSVFNKLAQNRVLECHDGGGSCDPINFSVSTYQFEQTKFSKKINEIKPPFNLPLTAMMIDIDDVKECLQLGVGPR